VKALIFTHPPDYRAAALSTEAWNRLGVEVTWAIERNHEAPEGQRHIFTRQPRRGNLNGLSFCLELFELMSGFDFKCDSDTLVFSLEWAKHTAPLIGFGAAGMQDFYGACWKMRRSAAPVFLKELQQDSSLCMNAEDQTVGNIGKRVGRHVHGYDPDGCPLAGWNWNTKLSEVEYRRRFQVINVQRSGNGVNARDRVVAKMQKLLDASP
jgi:hypothetical protein